jgi:regulator of sirC expression with transglutaminase-like and TPR domain
MNRPATRQPRSVLLPESRRKAFLKLLGDDNPLVHDVVRRTLVEVGPDVVEWIRPHVLSEDPVLRRHAREIVHHFSKQDRDNAFLAFCVTQGEEFDLEQAVLLFCSTRYSELNPAGYTALLDSYVSDLREELDLGGPPESTLATINEFLYERLGFRGNEEDYYDPENSYLNRVMDRRTGNPVNLSILYLLLARRLRLPVVGIGLPGHFVVRYQNASVELYIDAFNRGKILLRNDCVKYLQKTQHSLQEGHLAPVSPRRILLRICGGLHQIYSQMSNESEAQRIQRYLVALAK